jgi:SAM-dependent methyltransferase
MNCRHCKTKLENVFLDLGYAPPSNAYLNEKDLELPEKQFPLKLFVCHNCWLVQTEDYSRRDELFTNDYAYFSSVSSSWLEHALNYSKMITNRLELDKNSFVIELASNDGYLLKNFVTDGIPCVGIEPTNSTADMAEAIGVPTIREFFGVKLANRLKRAGMQAELIIGNNVYAHVPDINDFTQGMKIALKPGGTITLEFPHLLNLIRLNQFDTVYHEHFSYLSLFTTNKIFNAAGLKIYDVEKLTTHGGSLRIYGCHLNDPKSITSKVVQVLEEERNFGLQELPVYLNFQAQAETIKNNLVSFLKEQKLLGKTVGAYGAAAKGNTLLNFGKIDKELLPFVCDAAPSKQGKYLPGSHIPILPPSALTERKPDWVMILPWNIKDEVIQQQSAVNGWGGRFVVPIPELMEVNYRNLEQKRNLPELLNDLD